MLFGKFTELKFTHGPTNSIGAEDREWRNVPKSNQRGAMAAGEE
jgi:hypothetical protein